MSEPDTPNALESPTKNGAIRIRSNVCTSSDDWHLVPGDLIKGSSFSRHELTEKQIDEKMYYEPCGICHRTIYEIEENGCDNATCRDQGIMSTSEAKRRRVGCNRTVEEGTDS